MEKLSLADFRRNYGMTQQELADAIGVSRNYVAMIESGKKPFSEKLKQKLLMVNKEPDNRAAPCSSPPTACPLCAAKDKELYQSRNIIEMQAKTISDLTEIVKDLKADSNLNDFAAPASIVSGGGRHYKHPAERKDA